MTQIASIKWIPLEKARPLRNLQPFSVEALAYAHSRVVGLVFDGGARYLLASSFARRASGLAVPRVYAAGLEVASNFPHDRDPLGARGLTDAWLGDLRFDLELMNSTYEETVRAGRVAQVGRQASFGLGDQAVSVVRWVMTIAHNAGIRGFFDRRVMDLYSRQEIYDAVRQIGDKASVPIVKERLLGLGVTPEDFTLIDSLRQQLHAEREQRSRGRADGRLRKQPLLLLRAMILAELWLVEAIARAQLTPDRADLYATARLFSAVQKRKVHAPPPAAGTGADGPPPKAKAHGPKKARGTHGHKKEAPGPGQTENPGPVKPGPVTSGPPPATGGSMPAAPGTPGPVLTQPPAGPAIAPPAAATPTETSQARRPRRRHRGGSF